MFGSSNLGVNLPACVKCIPNPCFNTAHSASALPQAGTRCDDAGTLKYTCKCPAGYTSGGTPLTCNLANPCAASEDDCVTGLAGPTDRAKCNHVGPGKHSCTCPTGYKGDGAKGSGNTGCTDPNECASSPCATLQGAGTKPACSAQSAPKSSFTCAKCPGGYDNPAKVQSTGRPSKPFCPCGRLLRFPAISQHLLKPASAVWALECGVLISPRA